MKLHFKTAVLMTLGVAALGLSLLHLSADQTSLQLQPKAQAKPGRVTLKLQVQSTSNSVIYVIQTSTNLVHWETLVSGKTTPGAVIQMGDISPTNPAKFFRLKELSPNLVDTNPPAWTNGTGAQLTFTPPAGVTVGWNAATDNIGVAQYAIFLNGVLLTNVVGSTFSYQFSLDYQTPADIRIQAADASGNLSPILSLVYLPGNEIAAVSDDGGRVYVFNYLLTNSIQTNSGFTARKQIADFSSNDRGLALGDFDRDGILDLVAGNASGNTLIAYFFKGLGDGTFAAPVQLPTANGAVQNSYVMDMTAGDFDGDGNLDVAINGNYSYTVFYWGNGDGTFTPEVKNWADGGYFYGRGMAAGDFNEDGREDIARAANSTGGVKIFLSKGDRTFVETNLVASGLGNNDPYALAAGDFDEDGHLDLLVAGGSSGDVTYLKGFGDGTFTNITGTNGLWANLDIGTYGGWDAFDYNGDGHLDLVMAANNGQAYFWPGNGDGTFSTNRVTIATGMSGAFGASAPPRLPRLDVGILPRDPVTNLNSTITFSAVGTGVSASDFFRWTVGDTGTNPVAWTFGSGLTNMGATISHTYTNEGRFLTRLWHTATNGINSVRGTWAIVKGSPPVANSGGPYVFGSQVATQGVWYATLDGSASTDDFGIVSYVWNFGDGTGATNPVPKALHGWPSNGVYTVSLTVIDAAKQSDTQGTTITLTNGGPATAVIVGPAIVDETNAHNGTWTANFSGTGSTSPVGIWKYAWRNVTTGQTGTSATFQTTWTSVGTNLVTLTVTANDSQTNTTSVAVLVKANGRPVPVIEGPHLLSVNVASNGLWFGAWNATNSTDDTGIYVYAWNFGDGGTATGSQTTHNYGAAGIYSLTLKVTDNGNQSVSTTQSVIVVAGNPPVAKITASTLSPEGSQPISFSGDSSTSDHGIYTYTWFLPPRSFDFFGQFLDPNQWVSTYTAQNEKLTVTGRGSWGTSYFFSFGTLLLRGCAIQGQVETPSTSAAYAMVGLKNLNSSSGQYGQYPYAIYFNDGGIYIYENGGSRGQVTNYLKGTAYDFRIETKPGAGARYYLRPSGTGQAFTLIFDSANVTDASFSFGADVYAGVWSFDNFQVDHVFASGSNLTTPVNPGGTVTLQVVDNALLTNSTSVVVSPVIGAAPIAGINGPTNGQSGVELAFDGYSSSDDVAIANYTWDFGDGSPPTFGPAVSHSYNAPGVYTNQLTVADYANQISAASLVVKISGSNALVHVPWLIIQGIEQPHEVYSGKTNTLKAVARGIKPPFTYIWNYGDGSGSVTNVVTTAAPVSIYNLEARHAYIGGDGTPYYALVTVILTNGTVMNDTYPLLVLPKTLDREMKVAIDEGLWFLQKDQNRYDFDAATKGGDWTTGGAKINGTASAVHAFAINGHLLTDDAGRDPYVDTVQRGINFLLNNLTTVNIGTQTYGDPDGNHNGIGLQANSPSYSVYETGPVIDSFVAAARPELVAGAGGVNVKGRQFKDIVQDMVDMYCWGQVDFTDGRGGGWYYYMNGQGNDNSASQWSTIGLFAAEHFWGIPTPDWVKARNKVWIAYSSDGIGYGYSGPGSGPATTPSALVQLAFDGVTTTNAMWLLGDKYLANNWNTIMSQNNVYANYAIAKAMRTATPQAVHNFTASGKDWFLDPGNGLARTTIDHQRSDGSWNSSQWVNDTHASAWSIIILTSSLFQQGPVAVVNVQPNPTAIGYPTIFDARSSYHRHPGYKIVDYRWVFDSAKGIDFEHPDAVGPVVTNVFGSFSTNTVSLEVRDNGSPQLSDISSVVVLTTVPPYPPTADAGGPYVAGAGQDVHFDGSGSFCVDAAAGNFIQSYDWEVNYQVPVTFNQGVKGVHAVLTNGYPVAGNYTIGLRVKNANSLVYTNFFLPDQTADAFTTVYVYNRVITDLKVRPKATKAQLTWTKAGDYGVIMRSTLGPDRGFVKVGETTGSYATFLDTTIAYNTDYYYRIYAYQNGQTAPIGVSDPVFLRSSPRSFDARAPQFQSTPDRLAKVGQLYDVTLDAVDPQNQPIYFSMLAGPTNMTVNSTSGRVNFTPTAAQVGNIFLSFQVTNTIGRDVLSYTLFVFPATNHAPVAVVNGPYAALTSQNIQFSSAGTVDADNNTLRYYWNFGDGSTSTNPNPVHAYGGIGDYLVSLFVNDGYGGTGSAQTHAQITRPNIPPVAVVSNGPNFTVRLGETLNLNGSGSYSPLGNPLTYKWLWGDGASTNNASSVAAHLYGVGGPYLGQLIVADNKGDSNTNSFTVTVGLSNRPPVIVFAASSTNPYVESTVTFDASGSSDPDGDLLTFTWDFGDRSKTTGPLVTHVFHQIQEYTVVLTVADNHGGVSVATQTIHALNAAPVFTSNPQLLTRAGTNYIYTPTLTDADGDLATFQLVTGPATMSCDTNTGTLEWLPGTNNLGPNAVVLRATDVNGASTDQSFSLVVSTPLGPQIDLQPTHIDMSNAVVDSQTLAYSGTVRVYLSNNGSDAVPIPFTLSLFVDANYDGAFSTNDADYVVGYGVFPTGFLANGSGYVDMTVVGRAPFKDSPLYAFVDSQNVVPEYNKLNNIMRSGSDANTNTPPVIDLSASYLQVGRFTLPNNAVLTARLGNSGLVSVPTNVPIAFYDGDPNGGGQLIGVARTTTALVPGQYQDLNIAWSSPTITNHTVFVVADDPGTGTNLFQEITLSNNTFSVTVDLAAVLPPVAYAGSGQNVIMGDTVVLNGSGSFDPQGRPLTYQWSMRSTPIGSLAELTGTNTVNPSFVADLAGLYGIQLIVNNGLVSSTNPALVSIAANNTNVYYPPTITSTPSFQAIAKVPYLYAVTATDPQNKPLKFRLPQAPAGMVINTNSGLVQWTTTNSGSFFVQVAVDGVGGSFYQGYTLTVIAFTNLPPQFTSTPVTAAKPSVAYSYIAVAVSPVGNSITYSLSTKPAGMAINASSGVITWTPAVNQSGGNAVTVAANDGHGGTTSQSYNLVVLNSGTNGSGPVVQPIPSQKVNAPTTFAAISLDSYVSDPSYAANQIVWTATGTNLLAVIINSNRVATVLYPAGINVAEQITFLATDPAGKSAYSSPTFTAIGNAIPPVAAIANLSATTTTSMTDGTFQLLGTADAPGAPASIIIAWRVSLYDSSGARVANVTPGPLNAAGYHEGRVPAGGSFGNLDFTLVRNGSYTLMLEVTDGAVTANATAEVALNANYNIGQLKFSQQDLVLPVQGVGLQVSRSYDSLNQNLGDFGYGWTYSVADLGLTVGDQRVDTQDDLAGGTFSLRVGGTWDVTLTMPDTGRRVTFTFGLAPGGYFTSQAYWSSPPGVNASLVPTTSTKLVTLPGLPPIWQVAGFGSDWQAFDWPGFILTTKDGTQYRIDRVDQGEHFYYTDTGNGGFAHVYTGGFLSQVTETGGQHTDFVHNGGVLKNITQYDALSQKLKSILFQRDAQNRINAIYLPSNLDSNGVPVGPANMTYAYDSNGNLITASKLTDASNPTNLVYSSKSYVYGNPQFPHYLTQIIDPRGVSAMQTEYDSQGRVVAIIDAFGKRTVVQHDLAGNTETVYDRLGNPTLFAYDNRGNVVVQVDALGGVTQFIHDSNNNITMQVDPLGHTNLFTFDPQGNQLTHTDPLGNKTVNTYDSSSRLLTTTDPMGNTTVNAYDSKGNLTNMVDSLGNVTAYTYDAANHKTSMKDAAGKVTLYSYDGQGNLVQQTDPLGNITTYAYDVNGYQVGQVSIVSVGGGIVRTNVTSSTQNVDGAPTSQTDAAGNTTRWEYDPVGNPKTTVDALGNRSEFHYDEQNQLVQKVFADGTTLSYGYDDNGRRVSFTDRAGRTTSYAYDALGRMTNTYYPRDPGGPLPTMQTKLDAAGRVIAQVDELGNTTTFAYDADGRQIAETNALGYVTTSAYDANGNVVSRTDPLGNTTFFLYDRMGRPLRTIYTDGSAKNTTYDALGHVLTEADQAGAATGYEYDGLGHLTAVIDPLGQRTEYTYDQQGALASQRDANNHVTQFVNDQTVPSKTTTLPSGQVSTTAFNAIGKPASTTNFNGQILRYEYNANNQVSAEYFSEGNVTRFTYTPTGRRQTIADTRGVVIFAYDARDRLISRTDPDGRSVKYTYDIAGNRTRLVTYDPQSSLSSTQSFAFDALKRLQSVTAPDGGVTLYAYDAANNLISAVLPNGTVRTNYYDTLGRLARVDNRASTNVLSSYQYTLSATGDRVAVQEQGGRQIRYTYDSARRLLGETVSNDPAGRNRTNSYTYDPVGNRLAYNSLVGGVGSPFSSACLFGADDQVLAETNLISGDVTFYTYDNNGNTLSRSNSLQQARYSWNSDRRLSAATITDSNGVHRLAYKYDADGIRVGATIIENGTTNQISYLVDANQPNAKVLVEWTSLNGHPANQSVGYTYGLGLISQNRSGSLSYYQSDGLGSTRQLTDPAGLVTDSFDYDAYGQLTAQLGSTDNSYLFAGEQRDKNLNLDYLRDRYMSPSLGRFYGRDSVNGDLPDPTSLHGYMYARNNPVNYVDPSGRQFDLITLNVSLSINASIESYQGAFAKAGFKGIQRVTKISNHLIGPGVKLQEMGFAMILAGDNQGDQMVQLGMQLEQLGYTLTQSAIAGIYVDTFDSLKVGFSLKIPLIGEIKGELGLVKGSITQNKKKIGSYGIQDYDGDLKSVLDKYDKILEAVDNGPSADAKIDQAADDLVKGAEKILGKLAPGPTKYGK